MLMEKVVITMHMMKLRMMNRQVEVRRMMVAKKMVMYSGSSFGLIRFLEAKLSSRKPQSGTSQFLLLPHHIKV